MLVVAVVAVAVAASPASEAAAAAVTITVTSASDADTALCPSSDSCTLRAALAAADADESSDPVVIAFAEAAFPGNVTTTIALEAPLPAVARSNLRVDTGGRSIVVSGAALEAEDDAGIVFAGDDVSVVGLAVQSFPGTCLELAGRSAVVSGVTIGDCLTGLRLSGGGAILTASRIGFGPGGQAAPVGTGVVVTGTGTRIGEATPPPDPAVRNAIGNADVAILVGEGEGDPITATFIGFNVIGRSVAGEVAPAVTGIRLAPPSRATFLYANTFANIETAAIEVLPDGSAGAVDGNTFERNEFAGGGLAVDLGADGLRNPNGPPGPGPNAGVHHPLITRATQARVAGVACPGCRVELYATAHIPGDQLTQGTVPLSLGVVTADASGQWAVDSPPVTPGSWIAAIATDAAGNTSEFGPAARVGAGAIQCGNVSLVTGWNHSGFFGPEPLLLGDTIPGDPARRIRAIYQLADASGAYLAWFRDTPVGRTLTSLEPGSAYWFLADAPVTLPDGFALTDPIPVALQSGWNHLVYFGASDDVRDAFASLSPGLRRAYRWIPGGDAHWELFDPALPHWSSNLRQVPACASYAIEMTLAGTLSPLQP
jgi:hypothetical protein